MLVRMFLRRILWYNTSVGKIPFIEAYQRRKHEKEAYLSRSLAPDADSLWTEETREKLILPMSKKSNSAKIESFNKENRNLLEKAEEQQVFTKSFCPSDR